MKKRRRISVNKKEDIGPKKVIGQEKKRISVKKKRITAEKKRISHK